MIIASWNINGIRARLERLLGWLQQARPHVVCLQETKCEDDKFPRAEFESLGYRVQTFGQKSYNGVAIASLLELQSVQRGLPGTDLDQARYLAATVGELRVHCVYVPNGREVGSEQYQHKLAWLDVLRRELHQQVSAGAQTLVCGDFNVAPEPIDVHDVSVWQGRIHFSQPEREAMRALLDVGLVDVVRKLHPDEPLYTWWDYRMLAFPKNHGLRIDHMLATPELSQRVKQAYVDRQARKGKQPSDHAPVVVQLE